jgi:DNA invertase Pin-like site-specific DNA recombinase
MKRVAIYTRVSTKDQTHESQQSELNEYCKQRRLQVVEIYADTMSGAKDKRPALDRLMADARRGRFDAVLVYRFDRFARSVTHLLRALEEFSSLGVDFVSLSESIDTSTPMGRMVFTVLGAVAELERNIIRERVIAGQKGAKRRGVRFGRPEVEVDTKLVSRLRTSGLSWRAIAEQTGIPKDTLIRHHEGIRL